MTVRRFAFVVLAFAACGLTGCATIISGTKDGINVTSTPPGAKVLVDGRQEFTTPARLKLSRKHEHTLLVSMPGYHTEEVSLSQGVNGWVFGNLVIGGIIGIVVDLMSGATGDISPDNVQVDLVAVPPGQPVITRHWVRPGKRKKDGPAATPAGAGERS